MASWMVAAPARRNSVTSRSWRVDPIRSTSSLGLGGEGVDLPDAQLPHHPGELGGLGKHRRLTGIVFESRVAVAVEGQGDSPLPDQALQHHQIAPSVLPGVKDRLGHDAGGIVHGQEQHQLGPPLLQPGMVAAVDLH